MQIKVLVFTNHIFHKKESSLYPFLKEMAQHLSCEKVDVVSLGNPGNRRFIVDFSTTKLFATNVSEDFVFQTTGSQYINKAKKVEIQDYDLLLLCLHDYPEKELIEYLEEVFPKKEIINFPSGLYETTARTYFHELAPHTLDIQTCTTPEDIKAFSLKKSTLLYPLEKYSERVTLKLDGNDVIGGEQVVNFKVFILDMEEIMEKETFLAMRWDDNLTKGLKRIIVFSGEALGAKICLPSEIEWEPDQIQEEWIDITTAEIDLIQKIDPILKDKGICFYQIELFEDTKGELRIFNIETLFLESILDLIGIQETKLLNKIADKMITFALGNS